MKFIPAGRVVLGFSFGVNTSSDQRVSTKGWYASAHLARASVARSAEF